MKSDTKTGLYKADFKQRKLDGLMTKWLSEGLDQGELNEWSRILTYDTLFREEFCDWVKALRDPAWSRLGNKKGART